MSDRIAYILEWREGECRGREGEGGRAHVHCGGEDLVNTVINLNSAYSMWRVRVCCDKGCDEH